MIPPTQALNSTTPIFLFTASEVALEYAFCAFCAAALPADLPQLASPSVAILVYSSCFCRDAGVGSGYYSDVATSLGALQLWPEHRYYATEAQYTPSLRNYDYLNIEQALVDQIELVLDIQLRLGLDRAPVIAIGGSYSKCAVSVATCFIPAAFLHCMTCLLCSCWLAAQDHTFYFCDTWLSLI